MSLPMTVQTVQTVQPVQPVLLVQPGPIMRIGEKEGFRDWNSGLLSCFSDIKTLVFTWFCMPCTLCNTATRIGDCCLMPFCVPGATIIMRTRIRTLGGIKGSICCDCVAMTVCPMCAVCQMQRELNAMRL